MASVAAGANAEGGGAGEVAGWSRIRVTEAARIRLCLAMNSARSSVSLWSRLVGFAAALGAGRGGGLRFGGLVLGLLVVGGLAGVARAQCATQWLPGEDQEGVYAGLATTAGVVHAVAPWDPDGSGPMPTSVVVGGCFTRAGTTPVANLAVYSSQPGVSWSRSMPGLSRNGSSGVVYAFATLPNGDLVVGGHFTAAGGVPANGIARWNGLSWSPLGLGVQTVAGGSGIVQSIVTLPNGDILAGGSFATAGGQSAPGIARWDGTAWSSMSAGMNGTVYAIDTASNGDVLAGGAFTTAGGVAAQGLARWDGANWSSMGAGLNGGVFAISVMPNGDVIAGGQFTASGASSANRIARWDGSSWSALAAR